MAKLNQIIAVEKGIKSRVYAGLSEVYKQAQKADLFAGFAKVYLKQSDDGEDLPSEKKKVHSRAKDLVRQVSVLLTDLFDVTAVKDWSNCAATASITVDGVPLLDKVPVTYLLFLEKQLNDVRTFIGSLPTLDESESWTLDTNSGLYNTGEVKTHRTKKVQRPIVLYPATPEHPAQTQLLTEDVIAGYWSQVKQSGALTRPEKEGLVKKVENLTRAIKEAREAANGVDVVETPNVSKQIFSYLFGE